MDPSSNRCTTSEATGGATAPPGEAQHLRKRFHSLIRAPLKEANSNIPSPILKKAKLNNAGETDKCDAVLAKRHQQNIAQAHHANHAQPAPPTHHASHAHPLAHAQQAQQAQKTGRLAGEELYHWQQSWRKIMRESTVYFEGITDCNSQQLTEYKRASKYLKQVGCEITPFYDNDVTIIISRRPYNAHKSYPPNDIFSNVSQLKIKVWDYDKVFRFLKNLGVNVGSHASTSATSTSATDAASVAAAADAKSKKDNLYTLLKEEKIYGTTDRDPSAKRDDLHYLEKNYLFVYDLTQKVRPIAVREWSDDGYPILNLSLDGKCPFIFEPLESHKSERKRMRRLQKYEATKDYRALLKQATNDIMNNAKHGGPANTIDTETANVSTDRDTYVESQLEHVAEAAIEEDIVGQVMEAEDDDTVSTENDDGAIEEDIFKQPHVSPNNVATFAPPPLARYLSCVQPANAKFQDVAASGYNGASGALNFSMDSNLNSAAQAAQAAQGNGLGPMVSQVPSRNLNNLKKRITMKRQKSQVAYENTHMLAKAAAKEEKELNPGYCENCRVKYDHFDDHIRSNRHRNFASDDRNFKEIDRLIATLNGSKSLGYVTLNGDYRYV